MVKSNVALALALTSVLGGCAADVEKELATAAVTSSLETAQKQSTSRELVEPVRNEQGGCAVTAEEAAADAAARPQVGLFPAGCAQKSASGPDVHVEYAGCTGVFGRVELDGGVDAHFESLAACELFATIADSGNLTANEQALDYAATADIVVGTSEHQIALASEWSGTTRRGRAVHQSGDWDLVLHDATTCLDFSGSARGSVDHVDYAIDVTALSICPEACPSQGTVRARWEGWQGEKEVTVEFDGSDVARVTGWSGRIFEVPMVCADGEVAEESGRGG